MAADGILGIEFLEPGTVRALRSESGSLTVEIGDIGTYQDVKVFRSFPLSDPSKYISLRVGRTKSDETEIGVIRDLAEIEPESREILWQELVRRYLIHIITKIHAITEEFAFPIGTTTDKGRIPHADVGRQPRRGCGKDAGRLPTSTEIGP